VQGILIKNEKLKDKNTETGAALLKKIKAEKAKAGKKEKPLAPIKKEEIPFEIPDDWVWCRLGEIVEMSRGRFSIRPRNDPSYFGGNFPFIQIGSLDENGSILNDAPQTLNEKGIKVSKRFPKNTIAVAIVGGTIGNLGVLGRDMYFTDSIVGIIPSIFYNQGFILNLLKWKQPCIKAEAYQMSGQPNIKIPTLENLLIPLPPLSIQAKIVEKVNSLMGLCDEIEGSIRASQKQNEGLLQEVLRAALEGERIENKLKS
jgi:type I restriction enzyme, S subunit